MPASPSFGEPPGPTPPVRQAKWFPYKTKTRAYTAGAAGLLTLLLAICSVGLAWGCPERPNIRRGLTIVWGFWPPLWFLFEHYFWFDNWEDREAEKRFREGRDLWAKLWAGVGAILAALLFKFIKGPP
jgi:hypothetical protein